MASARLELAFKSGVVRVRNKTSGEIMVRVTRPDPNKPGKAMLVPLLVPPLARDRNLTHDATIDELRRSKTLDDLTSPPSNLLEVLI